MTNKAEETYRAWLAADEAWSAELRRAFGKQAGDMRYLPQGRGAPGSALRVTYEAFCAGREAWEAANRR